MDSIGNTTRTEKISHRLASRRRTKAVQTISRRASPSTERQNRKKFLKYFFAFRCTSRAWPDFHFDKHDASDKCDKGENCSGIFLLKRSSSRQREKVSQGSRRGDENVHPACGARSSSSFSPSPSSSSRGIGNQLECEFEIDRDEELVAKRKFVGGCERLWRDRERENLINFNVASNKFYGAKKNQALLADETSLIF